MQNIKLIKGRKELQEFHGWSDTKVPQLRDLIQKNPLWGEWEPQPPDFSVDGVR